MNGSKMVESKLEAKNHIMKRNVLIFGVIMGAIMVLNMLYMANLCYTNPYFESNDILGYTIMIVVFSLTYFGIRNYRNKELDGKISFGHAFKAGAIIVFIGSSMYVFVWLFYYYGFIPDYLDKYTLHVLHETGKQGGDAAAIAAKKTEMENFKDLYKNPAAVILISYAEVLPIGLVVALISALVLKRKKNTVTSANE